MQVRERFSLSELLHNRGLNVSEVGGECPGLAVTKTLASSRIDEELCYERLVISGIVLCYLLLGGTQVICVG